MKLFSTLHEVTPETEALLLPPEESNKIDSVTEKVAALRFEAGWIIIVIITQSIITIETTRFILFSP